MNCRICNSTAVDPFRAFDRSFGTCRDCGTIQRDMTEAQYRALDLTYDSGAYLVTGSPDELEARLGVPDVVDLLRRYRPANAKTMLDIGCGMGAYLRAGQLIGMDVTGYEPSKEHSQIASEVFGFEVRPSYFEGSDEKYDFITLSHVIEHIYDPRPFLRMILDSLNPGGRLLIVTPNAASLTARMTGRRWPMLVPEDHVTMLTPRSLGLTVPEGYRLHTTTSEYRHEFLATLGAAVRARRKTVCGGSMEISNAPSTRARLLRLALTVGSLPGYLAATVVGRRGALVATIDRPV